MAMVLKIETRRKPERAEEKSAVCGAWLEVEIERENQCDPQILAQVTR